MERIASSTDQGKADSDDDAIEDGLIDDLGVRLKTGLNIGDLTEGTEFEIELQPQAPLIDEPKDPPKEYFDVDYGLIGQQDEDEDEGDDDEAMSPFQRIEKKMLDVSGDRGIMKMVLRDGDGANVPKGSFTRVHYNAFLEYSDEPFDSSRLRGYPEKFTVGEGEMIPGLDIAVTTMRKGELSRFLIKPNYAYGERGCPPRIPPSSSIVFEVEIVSFLDRSGVDSYFQKSRQEKRETPFSDVMRVVRAEEEMAKDIFKREIYVKAKSRYRRLVKMLEDAVLQDEVDEVTQQKHLHKNLLNLVRCAHRLSQYEEARRCCKEALEINKDVTTLYLMGKSLRLLGEFNGARKHLTQAQKLRPSSKEINSELKTLDEKVEGFKNIEQQFWQRAFSSNKGSEGNLVNDVIETKGSEALITEPNSEFRRLVEERLMEFQSDDSVTEMPFFSGSMSAPEMAIIGETAKKLGIHVLTGEGRPGRDIKFSKVDVDEKKEVT